jgi:putative endonuclease
MPVTGTGMTEDGEAAGRKPQPSKAARQFSGIPLPPIVPPNDTPLLPARRPSRTFPAMKGYVYILASKRNGTLYTGVTSDLPGRLFEHQNELTKGFTSRYGVKTLVWFEEHDLVTTAITREKTIKKWPRQWKLNLIEAMNPEWEDIAHYLHGL